MVRGKSWLSWGAIALLLAALSPCAGGEELDETRERLAARAREVVLDQADTAYLAAADDDASASDGAFEPMLAGTMRALALCGEPGIRTLLELARTEIPSNAEIRAQAKRLLAEADGPGGARTKLDNVLQRTRRAITRHASRELTAQLQVAALDTLGSMGAEASTALPRLRALATDAGWITPEREIDLAACRLRVGDTDAALFKSARRWLGDHAVPAAARAAVARALVDGGMAAPSSRDAAGSAAFGSPREAVRAAAAHAARSHGREAVAGLAAFLRRSSGRAASAAHRALRALVHDELVSLVDDEAAVHEPTVEALAPWSGLFAAELLAAHHERAGPTPDALAFRAALARILGGTQVEAPDAGRALARMLRDPAPAVQVAVLEALGAQGRISADALKAAGEVLERDDPRTRVLAARVIGLHPKATLAVPRLEAALASDDDALVRAALGALAAYGADAAPARGAIEALTAHRSKDVAEAAAAALEALGR